MSSSLDTFVAIFKYNKNHETETGRFARGKNPKSGFEVPFPIGMITPTKRNEGKRAKMTSYMEGFYNNLKTPAHKEYAKARAAQMINGERRPSGMSAQYGIKTKREVVNLEIVLSKVFQAGRRKIRV